MLIAVAGIFTACNNTADTARTEKDSLDSVANARKDIIDSTAEQRKENIDSMTGVKKDLLDSTIKDTTRNY
jgi:hypothetical protein